jgi:hypothetical protein
MNVRRTERARDELFVKEFVEFAREEFPGVVRVQGAHDTHRSVFATTGVGI